MANYYFWPARDFQQPERVVLLHRDVTASLRPQSAFAGRELNLHWYTYYTKFANRDQAIAEFVSLASPGAPQLWRVVAYQIGVDPNAANVSK